MGNLGSSWLSREILLTVVFVILLFLLTLADKAKGKPSPLKLVLVLLGGLSGFLVVLTMSRVYMLTTVPVWNGLSTPVAFYAAGLLLGGQLTAAGYSALFYHNQDSSIQDIRSRWFQKTLARTELLVLVLVGMSLLISILFLLKSPASGGLGPTGPAFVIQNTSLFFIVRFFSLILGSVTLGAGLLSSGRNEGLSYGMRRFVYAGFFVLFIAEFLGRFLFYALYSRLGV